MIMEKEKKLLVLKKGHLLNHLLYLREKNEIYNRKKELLRMLGDIHREIVFGDLESERFKEMVRESLRIIMKKI